MVWKNKKGDGSLVSGTTVIIILAVVGIFIAIMIYLALSGKLSGFLDRFLNFSRFGT